MDALQKLLDDAKPGDTIRYGSSSPTSQPVALMRGRGELAAIDVPLTGMQISAAVRARFKVDSIDRRRDYKVKLLIISRLDKSGEDD